MTPLWRPVLAATGAILVAIPLDAVVPLAPRRSATRWPLLVLTSLLGCYLAFAIPRLAATFVLVLLASRALWRVRRSVDAPGDRGTARALLAVLAAFAVVMLVGRPSTPRFWDAFVWLGKARFAAGGLHALIMGGLRGGASPFIPEGYPLFEPMAVAILGGFSPSPRAVVAGAIGLLALAVLLFLCAIWDGSGPLRGGRSTLTTAAFLLLTSPLVFVHLRSSYVDLPLGLVVAAFAVLLPRNGSGAACMVIGMSAAALKDEGLVHIAVISLVAALHGLRGRTADDRGLVTRALACGIGASAVTGAWHLRLFEAGVVNSDHALSFPAWHRLWPLAGLLVTHLTDLRSWGALWVLAAGAVMLFTWKPSAAPHAVVWWSGLLLADGLAMVIGMLAAPERVMEFASGGSLLNRLLMQLAPMAALLVAAWVSPADTAATVGVT